MIVNKDINPERDVYYLGAKVIEIISLDMEQFDFFDVYQKISQSEKISMNLYSLTLDWLYLIGAVEHSDKGQLRKCF